MGEGEGGMIWKNSIKTCILSSVKQTASPGWMHETSAQGWCNGMTQRDGMGREVGGGSGWGTHVNPLLIHVNVWQKPLQYCKVISLQLIKIDGQKKEDITSEERTESCWGKISRLCYTHPYTLTTMADIFNKYFEIKISNKLNWKKIKYLQILLYKFKFLSFNIPSEASTILII